MKTIKASQVTHSPATEISEECSFKWGKRRNPGEGNWTRTSQQGPKIKECFVVVHMHLKGNCDQLQVRNERSVAKASLQISVDEV